MKKIAVLLITMAVAGGAFMGCARENPDLSGAGSADGGIPVSVDAVRIATLHGYTTAYGAVELDPGNLDIPAAYVRVTAPASGVIAAVKCIENQRVREGDILFVFDTTIADASVDKARNDFATAEKAFDRQKQMQAINATSDRQYLESERQYETARSVLTAAMTQRGLLDVKAPISGTVSAIDVRAGETVNSADIVGEIQDYRHLTVAAHVPVSEIGNVAAGQTASITAVIARDSDDERITGAVRYVSGSVDPLNGSVEVVVSLPENAPLRPGQFVQVDIAHTEHADCLAVPTESVVIDPAGQATVAVVTGTIVMMHTVSPGITENGLTEILDSDLAAGMMVVVTGAYGLPDHAAVQITNR